MKEMEDINFRIRVFHLAPIADLVCLRLGITSLKLQGNYDLNQASPDMCVDPNQTYTGDFVILCMRIDVFFSKK